jgi:phospholipid/cholesterol/gamma-HCH transport system substrate-binding protein
MKLTKNKKAIVVSLFTLTGIGIFVLGVLTLGGQHKLFVSNISIKASFENVSGLMAGNNVWFQGVTIGTVKSISFSSRSQVIVQMNIERKSCKFIPADAKAKIGSDGLMGNRIVVIEGGNLSGPSIYDGDTLQAEKSLTTDDLVNTLQKNNLNLLEITANLKTVSKDLASGKGPIGTLLRDQSLATNISDVVSTLKQAAVNTRQVTAEMANFSSKLQDSGTFTHELITDTLIFSRLRSTLLQVQEVTRTVNTAANNLQAATQGLNDTSKPVGALLHDSNLKETIRELLDNMVQDSKKLNEDLEAVQHNFLFRGYFRRKAKQQANQQNK